MDGRQDDLYFGSVIRNRRLSMGLTLQELALACGCTKAYLSTIENGRSGRPSAAILAAMEAKLGYAPGELARFAQATAASESVQWAVNKALEQVQQRMQGAAGATGPVNLDALLAAVQPAEPGQPSASANIRVLPEPLVRVPLLNQVTASRYPNLRTDLDYPAGIADHTVDLPGVHDANAFACTVLGDSMLPRYAPGDVVLFAPNEPVLSGDDCFVRLANTETTFKRVIDLGDGRLRLLPLNPAYPANEVAREDVTGLWRAVRRVEALKRASAPPSAGPAPLPPPVPALRRGRKPKGHGAERPAPTTPRPATPGPAATPARGPARIGENVESQWVD